MVGVLHHIAECFVVLMKLQQSICINAHQKKNSLTPNRRTDRYIVAGGRELHRKKEREIARYTERDRWKKREIAR